MQGFDCRSCGQHHATLPLSYGADAPAYWYTIPAAEHEQRVLLSSDQCVIDHEAFFVLGNIEIPILQSNQTFVWSVWVSLSEANFARASELWDTPGREAEPPYFGWLNSMLPIYPITLNLKTMIHTRPVGQRPSIELEPTDHPLAVEQRDGISWERVQEIAEMVLHMDQQSG